MNTIPQRIELLRNQMKKAGVQACIIPGTDPHASEYIADYWKEREWISGFAGSAGTVVVSLKAAGLWTDSRYFLEAGTILGGSGIELMKMGLPETPSMTGWIAMQLKAGEHVAINPQMISANGFISMKEELKMSGLELTAADLIRAVWTDRPALPKDPVFIFGEEKSGASCIEKTAKVREEIKKAYADVLIITGLDEIAWLFNIRGKDVAYNPVAIAAALVGPGFLTLFIDTDKVDAETGKYFTSQGVGIEPYHQLKMAVSQIKTDSRVMIDGTKLNFELRESIPASCKIVNQMSPVFKLKSIKNEVELEGIRRAMIKDGVALTRFFIWLEENIPSGNVTELTIAQKLYEYREEQGNFFGESFGTIAGYADHGAIVHYRAEEGKAYHIKPENILLIDSGGQYFDGTTDITRTITLGKTTPQQKNDFTLVLKGHIGIATAVFPVGTRGSQLDILARKSMWDRKMNYGHGTGHGIGHFLNVHEGPQSIRTDENPVTLQPGMILSNEPGMYRAGQYGMRTENLIHVIEAGEAGFGQFLCFETLTWFPIDLKLVETDMLTVQEKSWLNKYHRKVYEHIAPHLNDAEKAWLKEKTVEIS
jgi:Xaa-Pro aminopeptidase